MTPDFNAVEAKGYFETDLRCPACDQPLRVVATITVDRGLVRKASGSNPPRYEVSLKTGVTRFSINHECVPNKN